MKQFSLFLIPLLLLIVVSSCSKSVSGTYVNESNSNEYIELKSDGSFYLQDHGNSMAGKYEVDGKVVTLKLASGLATRARLEGDFIIYQDGTKRKKQ